MGVISKKEIAMFLSHIIYETHGLQYKEEAECHFNKCPNKYRLGGDPPDKFYYGRGYLMLKLSDNYMAASLDIFEDDRLYNDPD